MRNLLTAALACLSIGLPACGGPAGTPPPRELVTIDASAAAEPWLKEAFACAEDLTLTLAVQPQTPQVYLRLGEPPILQSPAYPIGMDELLIVTGRDSPLTGLSADQARELFAGRGDSSVTVWAFPPGEDIQVALDRHLLQGARPGSAVLLAGGLPHMLQVLSSDPRALGVFTRRALDSDLNVLLSIAEVEVLAIVPPDPPGAALDLIACLQK